MHCAGMQVFAGPPFHTMPFTSYMDYKALAVIINISHTSTWLQHDVDWTASAAAESIGAILPDES